MNISEAILKNSIHWNQIANSVEKLDGIVAKAMRDQLTLDSLTAAMSAIKSEALKVEMQLAAIKTNNEK